MNPLHELLLGINIDYVASLRQARGTRYPDPVRAALEAEHAGADLITMHLREDRRHIQDLDVERVRERLLTRLNLEMAVTDEMVTIALRVRPHDCCLVPERRAELTTETGLDVAGDTARIADVCKRLAGAGVRVALFVDPEPVQIEAAVRTGAPAVELHTGPYANALDEQSHAQELQRIVHAAEQAASAGLQVNAGHGLNYQNVQAIAALPALRELNIGHAIMARALFSGLAEAVAAMKRLMRR